MNLINRIEVYFYLVVTNPDWLKEYKSNDQFLHLLKKYYSTISNFLIGSSDNVTYEWYTSMVYLTQFIMFGFPMIAGEVELFSDTLLQIKKEMGVAILTVIENFSLLNKAIDIKLIRSKLESLYTEGEWDLDSILRNSSNNVR